MSQLLNGLADDSGAAIQSLFTVSLVASIVVILATLLHRVTRRHVSAKWQYAFWIVITLRFALFVVPQSPTSFLNLVNSPDAVEFVSSQPEVPSELILGGAVSTTGPLLESPLANSQLASGMNIGWLQFAFVAWMLGFIWFMFVLVREFFRVSTLVRVSTTPSPKTIAAFEKSKCLVGIGTMTRILTSDQIQSPAMVGLFRPVILMPGWCETELNKSELTLVLTHELIHIQRRDALIQLGVYLIRAVHWFNPLARLASNLVEETREISCDEAVLNLLDGGRNMRKKYGETILKVASRQSNKSPVCFVISGGFTGNRKSLIKQRIAQMIEKNTARFWGTYVSAALVLALISAGFTAAQSVIPQPSQTADSPMILPNPVPVLPKNKAELQMIAGTKVPVITSSAVRAATIDNPKVASAEFTEKSKLFVHGDAPGETNLLIHFRDGSEKAYAVKVHPRPPVRVSRGSSTKVKFEFKIPEIIVKNPAIATVKPIDPSTVLVTGHKYGQTEIQVANTLRQFSSITIDVIPNIAEIQTGIKKLFPDSKIKVDAASGSVILRGMADATEQAAVEKWVQNNFDVKSVVNQMLSDKPIAIQVEVYEVSKEKMKKLGVDFSGVKTTKNCKSISEVLAAINKPAERRAELGTVQHVANKNTPISVGILEKQNLVQTFVQALTKQNIARLTDKPVLITEPGRPAQFLNGGEVPIQRTDKNGISKIEFQTFGTTINTTPRIRKEGGIILDVRAVVSELAKPIGDVPQFNVQEVETSKAMKFGQTLVIVADYNKTPDKHEKVEMVYFLTPRQVIAAPRFSKKEADLTK